MISRRVPHFRNRDLVWLVLVIGGLARIASYVLRPQLIVDDADGYLDIARHLTRGEGFSAGNPSYATAFRPPLYPILVAICLRLTENLQSLAWLQVLLGTATSGLSFATARRWGFSSLTALIAAMWIAFDPVLIHLTPTAMTETLCTFLVALWAWFLSDSGSSLWRRDLPAGVMLGLVCLCRPTFLLAIPLIVLFSLARFPVSSQRSPPRIDSRPALQRHLIQVICAILTVCPWAIRNGLYLGKWTPATTHGGYTLLLGNNPVFYSEVLRAPWGTAWDGASLNRWQEDLYRRINAVRPPVIEERDRDQWYYREAQTHIRSDYVSFLKACTYRWARLWDILPQRPLRNQLPLPLQWGMGAFFVAYWLTSILGLAMVFRTRDGRWGPLLALLLSVILPHAVFWTDLRMRAPLMPILALLATTGLQQLLTLSGWTRPSSATKPAEQK